FWPGKRLREPPEPFGWGCKPGEINAAWLFRLGIAAGLTVESGKWGARPLPGHVKYSIWYKANATDR
ncbi:MAG TPA: hypothetical protein DEQ77_11745, partial [Candidatus Omnitrophica bacterium]|nr:hypothetical protein [Candidatus Omnitrophota bacterium]